MAIDYNLISDNSMIEILCSSHENVDLLEDILLYPSNIVGKAPEEICDKIQPGRILDNDELSNLAKEVFNEVNLFLNVYEIDEPETYYYSIARSINKHKRDLIMNSLIAGASASALGLLVNSNSNPALVCISSAIFGPALLVGISGLICIGKFDLKIPITPEYFRNQRAIGLLREPESLLAPSIGHEYDHHVTETTLEFANMTRENETPTFNIVKEGHARGVERHIAAYYAEKTSQSDFIEPTLRLTLGELSAAYMWLSDKLHIPSNTSALDINNVHYYNEIQFVDKLGRPSKHAIGNTLFCLAEAKQGKGIYADFVKGDFDFINKSFSA